MTTERLGFDQKRILYRDGFVVLRGFVDQDRVAQARRLVLEDLDRRRGVGAEDGKARRPYLGLSPVVVGLFNDTGLRDVIEEALGPVGAARACQLATRLYAEPGDYVNESGYRDRDTPFLGWHGHLDGLWNGATRIHQHVDRPMTPEEPSCCTRFPTGQPASRAPGPA